MVGGTVIEVVDLATKVYVNCADKPRGHKKADECAIYVERNSNAEKIEIGDAIWWQGGSAYWTPCANQVSGKEAKKRGLRCGVDYDIEIPRIGYSGVNHPSPCRAKH
jgi:hypothetical protein